jgi:hypothetical protein
MDKRVAKVRIMPNTPKWILSGDGETGSQKLFMRAQCQSLPQDMVLTYDLRYRPPESSNSSSAKFGKMQS